MEVCKNFGRNIFLILNEEKQIFFIKGEPRMKLYMIQFDLLAFDF